MDLNFNLRKEFHFQWRNVPVEDIFSLEATNRSFEVLTRSGELVEEEVGKSQDTAFFGYGNQTPEEILSILISQHGQTVRNKTPFSQLHYKQLAVLSRIYLAGGAPKKQGNLNLKNNASSKKKEEEEPESALVQIGVKAGLPLLFALIRRSQKRGDSQLCSEVFLTANEILLGMEPLSLYHHDTSSLGKESLDGVTKFLETSLISPSLSKEEKELAVLLMLSFCAQRGLVRNILHTIHFILQEQIDLSIEVKSVLPILHWFVSVHETDSKSQQTCEMKCLALFPDIPMYQFVKDLLAKHFASERIKLVEFSIVLLAIVDFSASLHIPTDRNGKDLKRTNEAVAVFFWGANSSNQLVDATSQNSLDDPTCSSSVSAHNPPQIEAGAHCTFVLSDDGNVYGCGKGEYGRLGLGNADSQTKLQVLSAFKDQFVKKITTSRNSYGHGLAIDGNDEIWSWGDGDYGKLGHGDTSQCNNPKKIAELSGKRIKAISCGHKHSACVTDEGSVYTWGLGDYGRLGHGSSDNARVPKPVSFPDGIFITSVSCGSSHTMALTDNGLVYSWGDGDHGKLGHGDSSVKRKPILIAALDSICITKIICGDEISLALSTNGQVYSWGKADYNGHGTSAVSTPKMMETLEPWDIVDICAGGNCMALSANGDVFTWGKAESGALGHGDSTDCLKPTIVTFLQGKGIKQISAGQQHCVAWTVENPERATSSSVRGLEKAPFCIDLHENTFLSLRKILEAYASDLSQCTAPFQHAGEQQSIIISCLGILGANLFHVTATSIDSSEIGLSSSSEILVFFRDRLLKLLNVCEGDTPLIQEAAQKTFEIGCDVLLPTAQERRIMLSSLLSQTEMQSEFSSAQCFMIELLVNSLLEDNNLLELPSLVHATKDICVPLSVVVGDSIMVEVETDKQLFFSLIGPKKEILMTLVLSQEDMMSTKHVGADGMIAGEKKSFELLFKEHSVLCTCSDDDFSLEHKLFSSVESIEFLGSGKLLSFSQTNSDAPAQVHEDFFIILLKQIEKQTYSSLKDKGKEVGRSTAVIKYLEYLQKRLLQFFVKPGNDSVLFFQHNSRLLGKPRKINVLVAEYGKSLIRHCDTLVDAITKQISLENTSSDMLLHVITSLKEYSMLSFMLPQLLLSLQIRNTTYDLPYSSAFSDFATVLFELLEKLDRLNQLFPTVALESGELSWTNTECIDDPFSWLVNVERTLGSLLGSWIFRCSSGAALALLSSDNLESFIIQKENLEGTTEESSVTKPFYSALLQGEPSSLYASLSDSLPIMEHTKELSYAIFTCFIRFTKQREELESWIQSPDTSIPTSISKTWNMVTEVIQSICKSQNQQREEKEIESSDLASFLDTARFAAENLLYVAPSKNSDHLIKSVIGMIGTGRKEISRYFERMEIIINTRLCCFNVLKSLITREGLLRSVQLQILRNCFSPAEAYFSSLNTLQSVVPLHYQAMIKTEIDQTYQILVSILKTAVAKVESEENATESLWTILCILRILGVKYFASHAIEAGILEIIFKLLSSENARLNEIRPLSLNFFRILFATLMTSPEDRCLGNSHCQIVELYYRLILEAHQNPDKLSLHSLLDYLCSFSTTYSVKNYTISETWMALWIDIVQQACLPERLMVLRILHHTLLSVYPSYPKESVIEKIFHTLANTFKEDSTKAISLFSADDAFIFTDGCALHRNIKHKAAIEANDKTFRQSNAAEIHNTGYVVGTSSASSGIHRWTLQSHHDARSDETLCVGVSTFPISNTNLENTSNMWLYRAYNGTLYHGGKGTSLEPFTIGDSITIEMDCTTADRTLTYYKNGKSLGVAFTGLPELVYPVILFYATSTRARASFIKYSYMRSKHMPFSASFSYASPEVALRGEIIDLIRKLQKAGWAKDLEKFLLPKLLQEDVAPFERHAALDIIGSNYSNFYRIGSRVLHDHLGPGTVIDLCPGDLPSLAIHYDSGLSMVTPNHYVRAYPSQAFGLSYFDSKLPELIASLSGTLLETSDRLVQTSIIRTLGVLLPGCEENDQEHLLLLLSRFLPLAVRPTLLKHVFCSAQLSHLIFSCQKQLEVAVEPEEPSVPPLLDATTATAILDAIWTEEKVIREKETFESFSNSSNSSNSSNGSSQMETLETHPFCKQIKALRSPSQIQELLDTYLLPALDIVLARELILHILLTWKEAGTACRIVEVLEGEQDSFCMLFKLLASERIAGFPRCNFVKVIRSWRSERLMALLRLPEEFAELILLPSFCVTPFDNLVMQTPSFSYVYGSLQGMTPELLPFSFLVDLIHSVHSKNLPSALTSLVIEEVCRIASLGSYPFSESDETETFPQAVLPLLSTALLTNTKFSSCPPLVRSIISLLVTLDVEWIFPEDSSSVADCFASMLASINSIRALQKRNHFPDEILEHCALTLMLVESDPEAHWADNTDFWSKQMDKELLQWTSDHPDDWCEPIEAFMFGGSEAGQILDAESNGNPFSLDMISQLRPKQVICGSTCTVVLSEDGTVYACGKGEYGRLGIGSTDNQSSLVQLTAIQNVMIRNIALSKGSYGHALAIDDAGNVWSWGDGDYGKLGHGNTTAYNKPKMIEGLRTKQIVSVSCGFKHSAAISSHGDLYTWGMGDYGRLGHGDSNDSHNAPKKVEAFEGMMVTQVTCGSSHTLALTQSHGAWSWGDGDYGKLGHGDTNTRTSPEKIEMLSFQDIKKVEAGEEFSLALTENGRVISWGRHNSNVLGNGEDGHLHIPLIISHIEEVHIIDITVGASHCIALAEDNKVYTWGNNSDGQLGLGHKESVLVPQLVESFTGKRIRQISAGSSHSAVWTAETPDQASLVGMEAKIVPPQYSSLLSVPFPYIAHRLIVLQYISEQILSFIHLCNFEDLANEIGINELPYFIAGPAKQTAFRKQLCKTSNCEADITIQLDGNMDSIFDSFFLQLATLDPTELRDSFRPFKIRYQDAIIEDYESIHCECMEQLEFGCSALFEPTPNATAQHGFNQDAVWFSSSNKMEKEKKFKFFGRYLGMAIRTKAPLHFHLPDPGFKLLANEPLTVWDMEQIDLSFTQMLGWLETASNREIEDQLSPEEILFLTEKHIFQPYNSQLEVVKEALLDMKCAEWRCQAQWIRFGMKELLPVPLFATCTSRDLKDFICASDTAAWEDKQILLKDFPADSALTPALFLEAIRCLTSSEKNYFCQLLNGTSRPAWDTLSVVGTDGSSISSPSPCSLLLPTSDADTAERITSLLRQFIHFHPLIKQ